MSYVNRLIAAFIGICFMNKKIRNQGQLFKDYIRYTTRPANHIPVHCFRNDNQIGHTYIYIYIYTYICQPRERSHIDLLKWKTCITMLCKIHLSNLLPCWLHSMILSVMPAAVFQTQNYSFILLNLSKLQINGIVVCLWTIWLPNYAYSGHVTCRADANV